MRRGILPLLVIGTLIPGAVQARGEKIILAAGGGEVRAVRILGEDGRTREIRIGERVLQVEDQGFRIRLQGREEALEQGGMTVRSAPETEAGRAVFRFAGRGESAGWRVRVEYEASEGLPLFRKQLEITWKGEGAAPRVDRVEVERLRFLDPKDAALALEGGREEQGGPRAGTGRPLFAGGCLFLGLEHPAGWNLRAPEGWAVLRHHPEKAPPVTSFSAVLGCALEGRVHRAFRAYLDRIRRRPPAAFPHYNSWYDTMASVSAEGMLEAARGFKAARIPLVSMAVDDFWQNKQSIWQAREDRFPGGLAALSEKLGKLGFRLGLWMPLCGFKLDMAWGAEHGYEKDPRGNYYRLDGPRYVKELKSRIRHFIEDCRIDYFKMDFNFQLTGHKTAAGFERGVEQTLALLEYMASLDPEVFLNVTSFVHLSPWWLRWADFCWLGGADVGYDPGVPAIRGRDRELTYRDQRVYENILQGSPDFPLSALMFHGIVHGRYCLPGGKDEPVAPFLDGCVLILGQGCMLQEVYVTPSLMTGPKWAALREALAWSGREHEILAQAQAFGGAPAKGEVFGYRAARGGEAVVTLRNPTLEKREVAVPLASLYTLSGAPPARAEAALLYPRRRRLPAVETGGTVRLVLGAHETVVARVWPEGKAPAVVKGWPSEDTLPPACRVEKVKTTITGGKNFCVRPPGEGAVTLVVAQAVAGGDRGVPSVTIQGEKAALRSVGEHSRWWTGVTELPPAHPVRGLVVRVEPGLPPMGGEGEVRVYLLTRRKEPSPPIPGATAAADDGPVLPGAGPFPPALAWSERIHGILALDFDFQAPEPERRWPAEVPRRAGQVKTLYLALDLFGSNAGMNKEVWVDGKRAALLPANPGTLDAWSACLVPLPGELVEKALDRGLEVQIRNPSRDYFKLRNPCLAARLDTGTLVLGPPAEGTWTGVKNWAYFEGKPFEQGRSPAWVLRLP